MTVSQDEHAVTFPSLASSKQSNVHWDANQITVSRQRVNREYTPILNFKSPDANVSFTITTEVTECYHVRTHTHATVIMKEDPLVKISYRKSRKRNQKRQKENERFRLEYRKRLKRIERERSASCDSQGYIFVHARIRGP